MPADLNNSPGPRADVLLYVQHLLGIGHIRRAAALARAFRRAGLKVVFVTGGLPVGGLGLGEDAQDPEPAGSERGSLEVVQLPPARSQDDTFKVILDENDRPIDDAWKTRRRDLLLEVYHRHRPRVVLTELYPFGRRKMRFELEPLIEAARAASPPALLACSLRDIVNRPEGTEKSAWMVDRFTRLYDLLYVHGDPAFFRLEDSFPESAAVAQRLHYTGYVTEAAEAVAAARRAAGDAGRGEVIVSAGGGAVGTALLQTALAARPLSPLAEVPWRLLIGPNMPEEDFRALAARAPSGVTVERARKDFVALLTRARLSISQAGYNTLMEIMAAGLPGVVVPFAGGNETEQTQRAEVLAKRGLVSVVDEAHLTPATLAEGIARALAQGGAGKTPFRFDGAAETARHLIAQMKQAAA